MNLWLLQSIERAIADPSRENFCNAFRHWCIYLEVTDLEVARLFEISRPTVGRWCRGEAAPHPVGRLPVLKALLARCSLDKEDIRPRRPFKPDQYRVESGDWCQASGACICLICGFDYYYAHADVRGYEWLNRLCDGRLVKL